ncbi:uncharacterized protein LAESUDRAFT_717377 [Laetiporus sulphureus 93-53]|uniref:Uncharacterized protein n=1 Tax=Laetiporus sulphureus 93-53 TaxID=1314785 RepID=A0A165BSW2_9APHY|nr:uncharacterized protein LAESUDRAFT_717377 [Laetiporus sulphureus 93-53]KZT01587.1 hypothetical protein LAESUDRAFT_717377 [Laetiporus sulphureus 93-53]
MAVQVNMAKGLDNSSDGSEKEVHEVMESTDKSFTISAAKEEAIMGVVSECNIDSSFKNENNTVCSIEGAMLSIFGPHEATTTVHSAAEEASAGSESDMDIGGENDMGRCTEDATGHLAKDEYDPVACTEAAPLLSSTVQDASPGAVTAISSTINTVVSSDVSEQDEDKTERVMLPGLDLSELEASATIPVLKTESTSDDKHDFKTANSISLAEDGVLSGTEAILFGSNRDVEDCIFNDEEAE